MQLQATVCLITGGTRGIGASTAIALAERGAYLAIVARHHDQEAEKTRLRIEATGRRCLLITADLAKPEEARRCVKETAKQLGPIDVLVHSAGGPVDGSLLEVNEKNWYAAFDVHVHAVFHLCREVVPMMKPRRKGVIILISSVAGLRGIKTNIAYQVAKGALPQFTRALAYELAEDNIRVNCVAPGVIRTAFHARMTPETRQHNLANRIPLHVEGSPDQVASLIRELIANDFVTGETFTIDGGMSMRIC